MYACMYVYAIVDDRALVHHRYWLALMRLIVKQGRLDDSCLGKAKDSVFTKGKA